jgi:hypothetical protein
LDVFGGFSEFTNDQIYYQQQHQISRNLNLKIHISEITLNKFYRMYYHKESSLCLLIALSKKPDRPDDTGVFIEDDYQRFRDTRSLQL